MDLAVYLVNKKLLLLAMTVVTDLSPRDMIIIFIQCTHCMIENSTKTDIQHHCHPINY